MALDEARKMEKQLLDVRKKALDQYECKCFSCAQPHASFVHRYDTQLTQLRTDHADEQDSTQYAQLVASVQFRFRKNIQEISHELLLNAQQQDRRDFE